MSEAVHTAERLKELQALPLERKIQISQARIIEWYQRWNGNVVVSFSGGKDSTVLLHLVRTIYPDVPAVFSNTGLEYPEIQRFVRTFPNVQIVTPKMRFDQVISKYGYPLIGKEVAEAIYYARRIRSQSVQVERENKTPPRGVSNGNSSESVKFTGGGTETRSPDKQRDLPTAQNTTWATGQKRAADGTTSRPNGRQRDFKRIEFWGAEQALPVDMVGLPARDETEARTQRIRETSSRGSKWGDYHRRSLNNDPNDPRDRECFFNRDPKKTDWSDWRRGCL